jgi:hypothetical protein
MNVLEIGEACEGACYTLVAVGVDNPNLCNCFLIEVAANEEGWKEAEARGNNGHDEAAHT